jgi:hypothetical protein
MRAGAPLGEPLTWKYPSVLGVSSDSSWSESNTDDAKTMTLNGINIINKTGTAVYRFGKMQTTYNKQDNDAYTLEMLVQSQKAIAYGLRKILEETYVGRGGNNKTVATVPATVARALQPFKDNNVITDSVNGSTRVNAWRNIVWSLTNSALTVDVTVSLTPEIDVVLTTITAVPPQLSGSL